MLFHFSVPSLCCISLIRLIIIMSYCTWPARSLAGPRLLQRGPKLSQEDKEGTSSTINSSREILSSISKINHTPPKPRFKSIHAPSQLGAPIESNSFHASCVHVQVKSPLGPWQCRAFTYAPLQFQSELCEIAYTWKEKMGLTEVHGQFRHCEFSHAKENPCVKHVPSCLCFSCRSPAAVPQLLVWPVLDQA